MKDDMSLKDKLLWLMDSLVFSATVIMVFRFLNMVEDEPISSAFGACFAVLLAVFYGKVLRGAK
jgi:hypothetical protein